MFGRFVFDARTLRAALIVVIAVRIGTVAGEAHADAAEAKKIFSTRCMACHTFGKGIKVGPDLKGVTERRQRPWLLKFIRSSQTVIKSGDPIATELFATFKQQQMPDWTDLSEEQIGSILDYLAANGPDQKDIDERFAESATLAEIENGRQLFHGERAPVNGGSACSSCHPISGGRAIGGSLGPDLTDIYSRYQDGWMTQSLRHPCVQRLPESTNRVFLTPEESFYLKAYLRQTELDDRSGGAAAGAVVSKPVDKGPGSTGSGTGAVPAGSKPTTAATRRIAWSPTFTPAGTAATPKGRWLENTVLFVAFPYAAVVILILGLFIRFVMARRLPDGGGAAAKTAWQLYSGGGAWRTGLAITLILHLLILLIPTSITAWNGAPLRLYLIEGSGLLFGLVALAGWVQIMWRYLNRAAKQSSASETFDSVLLSLLGLALASGLVTAVLYRWGSSWGAATVAPYTSSLVRGEPLAVLVEQLPFLFRLHLLLWFAVLALIPFTTSAFVIVTAAYRILLVIARPVEAMAGAGRRAAAKLSPARWLWPEEDAVELSSSESTKLQEPS
jgi:nitrate reductase gamma subunit